MNEIFDKIVLFVVDGVMEVNQCFQVIVVCSYHCVLLVCVIEFDYVPNINEWHCV